MRAEISKKKADKEQSKPVIYTLFNEKITFELLKSHLGAAVDIPRRVHKYLSTLGPKLYFLRVPKEQSKEDDYLKYIQGDDFADKIKKIHDALFDYLKWFELCPDAMIEQNSDINQGREMLDIQHAFFQAQGCVNHFGPKFWAGIPTGLLDLLVK